MNEGGQLGGIALCRFEFMKLALSRAYPAERMCVSVYLL